MTQSVKPQDGFQYEFLSTSADIAIGGGSAGAGKSWALLMECLRHTTLMPNRDFGAVIFRRTYPEIMNQGGLWDESEKMFYSVGGTSLKSKALWQFPSGAKVAFSHLQHEKDIHRFQGAQIPYIGFDELTHFTEQMFFYLLSRNRTACGIKPYVRATCNPDPDSWVARFLEWWINQDTGYPIPDRSGVLRYFIKQNESYIWGDSKEEVIEMASELFDSSIFEGHEKEDLVKSVTFIPGTIDDNKELLKNNPEYLANLLSQDSETQMRLLRGNWKLRADKLGLFDPFCLKNMFSNDIDLTGRDFIVIDHARFGKDFCVIGTWKGWFCRRVDILPLSDTLDITLVIKSFRAVYKGIPMSQVLIDQDGIGVKDNLGCRVFQPGGTPHKVRMKNNAKKQDLYKNRKTQCAFMAAEKVNGNEVFINQANVWFHPSQGSPRRITSLQLNGKIQRISDLFYDDLRVIKRENFDTDQRKQITNKKEQKTVLGRSPDFGDMVIMRAEFEFLRFPKGLTKH
jgi:hypothetical protein